MRCGKSCRLRWMNYLRPGLKKGNYCHEEEQLIIKLHNELGNRWSAIAEKLPGRSDNDVKNHWHAHLKKRLRSTNTYSSTSEQFTHESSQFDSQSCEHDEDGYNLSNMINGMDWIEENNNHIKTMEQLSSINTVEQSLPNNSQTETFDFNFWSEPLFDDFWTQSFFLQ